MTAANSVENSCKSDVQHAVEQAYFYIRELHDMTVPYLTKEWDEDDFIERVLGHLDGPAWFELEAKFKSAGVGE